MFISQCKNLYSMSEFTTVDEQLSAFRGKCPFRVYIPSKPAKYEIKIWVLADSLSFYCGNAQVYLGKIGNVPEKGQGARVVRDLTECISGTGRNVTMDNLFTDVDLAKHLLTLQLTMTGTVRKNKSFIPPAFDLRDREISSSIFAFHDNVTLTSYVPKRNKAVILLSTMHHDAAIDHDKDDKPEIITFYNSTKSGVDVLDKLCAQYSCKRSTRRWPLSLFFTILDIMCHNSSVLFFSHQPQWRKSKDKRRFFPLDAAHNICSRRIHERMNNPSIGLQRCMKRARELFPAATGNYALDEQPTRKTKGRCYSCERKLDIKIQSRCSKCKKFVCAKHSKTTTLHECNICE